LLHGINAGILSCEGRRKGGGWANWAATTTAFWRFSNLKDVFIAKRFDQKSVVVA
jgi:hypothetical protein